jgi:hypothetical protein
MSTAAPEERKRKHAARMFAWEEQVASDLDLLSTPHAMRVIVLLRPWMDLSGKTRRAIDHKWMAKTLGLSNRMLRYTIRALVRRNHVEIIRSFGSANVYLARLWQERPGNTLPTPSVSAASTPATDCHPVWQPVADGIGNPLPTRRSSFPLSNSGKQPSDEAATDKKRTQRDKLKARQEAENEIAKVIGWSCVQEIPPELFEDLCCRWQRGKSIWPSCSNSNGNTGRPQF